MKTEDALGIQLEEGMPVAVLRRDYDGGFKVSYRGTLVGFKVNPKSTSAKIESWCAYANEMKIRTARLNTVVVDAKALLENK